MFFILSRSVNHLLEHSEVCSNMWTCFHMCWLLSCSVSKLFCFALRFVGWDLGRRSGFQRTNGTVQDSVPDSGLFDLLHHRSWYGLVFFRVLNVEEGFYPSQLPPPASSLHMILQHPVYMPNITSCLGAFKGQDYKRGVGEWGGRNQWLDVIRSVF